MPSEPRKHTTFRLLVRLPIVVHGGITRWRIQAGHQGKNGGYYGCYANSLSGGETLKITEGRARGTEHREYIGVDIERGTMLHKIFSKLVREGRAEEIPEDETIAQHFERVMRTGRL